MWQTSKKGTQEQERMNGKADPQGTVQKIKISPYNTGQKLTLKIKRIQFSAMLKC